LDKPFFSIIIPIFDVREDYFNACMRSIFNQSFTGFEVIIVNDGSRCEIRALCDMFKEKDTRVRVIHQENQGVSAARNNGIQHATADWIMFVDADDWLAANACERLKTYLDGKNWDILLFSAIREYAHKQVIMTYGLQHGKTYNTANVEDRELLYRRAMRPPINSKGKVWPIYYSWDKVFKRVFLIENHIRYPGGIPKSEDKIFLLRCFEKLSDLHCVEDALYHYRINAGSVCRRYIENADSDRLMLAKMLEGIAQNMDRELGLLKNDPGYSAITSDYKRFVFGIISDVLLLKYYHPDCPYDKETIKRESVAFLHTETFKSAVQEIPFSQLSCVARLKKWLLIHGLIRTFCSVHRLSRKFMLAAPQD